MPFIITAQEISDTLSLTVSNSDIARAQSIIELVTGVDLATIDPAVISEADLQRLKAAVMWQCAYLDAHPEAINVQPNVQSFTGSGAGISFFEGQDGILAPLAAKALSRLSWAAGPLSVASIKPSRGVYEPQPDPWVYRPFGY